MGLAVEHIIENSYFDLAFHAFFITITILFVVFVILTFKMPRDDDIY